jgi:hypothetical protein
VVFKIQTCWLPVAATRTVFTSSLQVEVQQQGDKMCFDEEEVSMLLVYLKYFIIEALGQIVLVIWDTICTGAGVNRRPIQGHSTGRLCFLIAPLNEVPGSEFYKWAYRTARKPHTVFTLRSTFYITKTTASTTGGNPTRNRKSELCTLLGYVHYY